MSTSAGRASEIVSILALIISALALNISALTAWVTLFRRGTVKMTQPTVIFFGFGEPRSTDQNSWPKVFLRTLLFSTGKRGRIIESLYVRLACDGIVQDFNVWVYGDRNELVRGSGLFVGDTGVEANHHFLTPTGDEIFQFIAGAYKIDVYVHLLGSRRAQLLFSYSLDVSEEEASLRCRRGVGRN